MKAAVVELAKVANLHLSLPFLMQATQRDIYTNVYIYTQNAQIYIYKYIYTNILHKYIDIISLKKQNPPQLVPNLCSYLTPDFTKSELSQKKVI